MVPSTIDKIKNSYNGSVGDLNNSNLSNHIIVEMRIRG